MLIAQKKVQLHLHFKQPARRKALLLGSLKSKSVFKDEERTWGVLLILKQACSPEYQRAQCAFKDSMIHWILQFTLRIAFRCVLHRCESQEIRCWKLYFRIKLIHDTLNSDKLVQNKLMGLRIFPHTQACGSNSNVAHKVDMDCLKCHKHLLWMILPQVHLRKPCYDFYFL